MSIETISTRKQTMDYLEGYVQKKKEEIDRGHTSSGLVKSYLLETVPGITKEPEIEGIFKNFGARLDPIDDTLYKVWNGGSKNQYTGFLEKLIPRHPVYYTMEDIKECDPWIRRFVDSTPNLDRLWISGRIFEQLWEKVIELNSGQRYGRLVFEYENFFEIDIEEVGEDEDVGDIKWEEFEEKTQVVKERRSSRFAMVERIEEMKTYLPRLQEIYSPLFSISQLRFPSTSRGGHDFYYNGKVTNRSDSFSDHRAHLLYVLKIYKGATEDAEQTAWYSMEKTTLQTQRRFTTLHGAPVVMKFSSPLSVDTFEKWITSTFNRKNNKFRLWGNPIRISSEKVHIYGADRHLWQPIFLELTTRHVIAILPKGTCGNTIHRLVTNIQHYIDSAVEVSIGDRKYNEIISTAIKERGIQYESD
ncbi:TPA: hypothetical protein DCX16_06125 [bacterium]|nr:hypothetical protein [bacterium]